MCIRMRRKEKPKQMRDSNLAARTEETKALTEYVKNDDQGSTRSDDLGSVCLCISQAGESPRNDVDQGGKSGTTFCARSICGGHVLCATF
jgi:hypothetical protein